MLTFKFENVDDEFYQLYDNKLFIDWCIYNELIEEKKRNDEPEDIDTDETNIYNKKLWNNFVIKYQFLKNGKIKPPECDVSSEIFSEITTNFKINKQFPFDNDTYLGDTARKPLETHEQYLKKQKDMLFNL